MIAKPFLFLLGEPLSLQITMTFFPPFFPVEVVIVIQIVCTLTLNVHRIVSYLT